MQDGDGKAETKAMAEVAGRTTRAERRCAIFRLLMVVEISEKYTLRALSIINVVFVMS